MEAALKWGIMTDPEVGLTLRPGITPTAHVAAARRISSGPEVTATFIVSPPTN